MRERPQTTDRRRQPYIMKHFKAKIISNKKIAPEHYILSFRIPKNIEEIKPGQFFNVRVKDACQPFLRRPFGAHNIRKDNIEILYKVVGNGTRILSGRVKGELLDVIGPLGNGFSLPPGFARNRQGREPAIFLVAGGHGIAPLYALARKLYRRRRNNSRFTVLIGARTRRHVVCDKKF